ncbi:hypothetical protein BDW22DRAFT_1427205 [Trametopsis cervina]|nr:hypothetical protein BDW22DRAFT_1427205 [Trametopsis cervina]
MGVLEADDAALLASFGHSTIQSFVSVVVSTWIAGLYTWLVIKAGSILLQKERRRRRMALVTWSIVLTMYLIKLTLWFIDARQIIASIELTLIDSSSPDLAVRRARANNDLRRLSIAEDVLYAYMTVLGDAIVLWRVYAFWHEGLELLALIVPCAVYLASVVCAGLVTYCAAQSGADLSFGAFTNPPFCQHIQSTSYWMQFAMAIVATALIGLKTWRYRQMVKSLINNEVSWRSPVNRAMWIMLDTGLLYSIFFLAEAVLGVIDLQKFLAGHPARGFALEIYQYQTSAIVGIYPTIIVILVHTHTQSFLMDSEGSYTITTLQFDTSPSARSTSAARRPHHLSHNHNHFNNINSSMGTESTNTGLGDVRARRSLKFATRSRDNHNAPPEISLCELRTGTVSSMGEFEDGSERWGDEEVDSKGGVKGQLERVPTRDEGDV